MTNTPIDVVPVERLVVLAPPELAGPLRQLFSFIDAPASAQGLQRVASNLKNLQSDLRQIAKHSAEDLILWPNDIDNSLLWLSSEAGSQCMAASGIDPLGGDKPPRGTLTAHPVYAAMWLVLSINQMRVRDALVQVLAAHAMLPATLAGASKHHSAREKACRAVREFAKLEPRMLPDWLPAQKVRSASAYAAELEAIIDSKGTARISAYLGSIRYLIEISTEQRKVKKRDSGGQHQSSGQQPSRPQGQIQDVNRIEKHCAEDVGATVTVVSGLPPKDVIADLENSGSISTEIEPSSETFIVKFDDEPGAERSAMQNRLRVQAVGKGIARSNQKLVGQVTNLSLLEIDSLVEEIIRTCSARAASPISFKSAMLVCCSLATGQSFEDLAGIVDGTANTEGPVSLEVLGVGSFFKVRALALQGAQDLTAPGREQAVETGASAWLPCPSLVKRLLVQIRDGSAGLNTPMGAVALITGAQDFLAKASKVQSARFTERRIQGWLFGQILNLRDGGIAAASLITATNDPLATNPAQYLTLSSSEVIDLYLRAVEPMNRIQPVVTTDTVTSPSEAKLAIGSRYSPLKAALTASIAKMQDELEALKAVDGNFVAVHNAMTLYTVNMSCFACGFRTVREPILRPSEIDKSTGFAVLQDKDSQDGYNARLIWVPLTMRRQLQLYEAHIGKICQAIRKTDPKRYQQLQPPPVGQSAIGSALFLLDKDGVSRPATVMALREAFADVGWHLPLNAGRHYLQTSLRSHCSNDTMLAFLGHWSRGTEPWSAASAFDPEMYRADIAPALTKLLADDGWKPVSGFSR